MFGRRRGGTSQVVGVAVALVLLAACSPSAAIPAGSGGAGTGSTQPAPAGAVGPQSVAELAAYAGADRQQILEADAQKEGHLTWYTSLAGPVVDALLAGYQAKYPFVQADVFRGAEDDLVTRATQEAQAGQQVFDVLESPPDAVHILLDATLLGPYYSPALDGYADELKDTRNGSSVAGTTIRVSYIGFGYNTTLLPDSAVPHTYQDLLNPALSGKMALAGSTTGYRWVGAMLHSLGDDAGKQLVSQIASQQNPEVQQVSAQALLGLIVKGEVVASPTIFLDHVDQAQSQQQAPVKWQPLEPAVANTGEAALAAKTTHPGAALLFIDYLLTDGQQVLKQYSYLPGSEAVLFQAWVPESGRTTAQMQSDAAAWAGLFKSDFR